MKFTACDGLDFEVGAYSAKLTSKNGNVFWMRESVGDMPTEVQFCKKRGRIRLNNPNACTSERHAICSEYIEIDHDIDNENIGV
jgi:hypothetical protein